jgi:hypothetical protein
MPLLIVNELGYPKLKMSSHSLSDNHSTLRTLSHADGNSDALNPVSFSIPMLFSRNLSSGDQYYTIEFSHPGSSSKFPSNSDDSGEYHDVNLEKAKNTII